MDWHWKQAKTIINKVHDTKQVASGHQSQGRSSGNCQVPSREKGPQVEGTDEEVISLTESYKRLKAPLKKRAIWGVQDTRRLSVIHIMDLVMAFMFDSRDWTTFGQRQNAIPLQMTNMERRILSTSYYASLS